MYKKQFGGPVGKALPKLPLDLSDTLLPKGKGTEKGSKMERGRRRRRRKGRDRGKIRSFTYHQEF